MPITAPSYRQKSTRYKIRIRVRGKYSLDYKEVIYFSFSLETLFVIPLSGILFFCLCSLEIMPHITQNNPENWLNNYGDMLYRFALIRVRSEATAEDLVQETLLAGIQSFDKFSGQSSVSTWLTGILKHKIIDHFRKNRYDMQSLDDFDLGEDLLNSQFDHQGKWQVDLVEWATPDRSLNEQQFWQVFQQCLDRLPKKMADLLLLRTMGNVSSEDCCQVLGYETTNQLWVTLSRTRMKLRQCLDVKWFKTK